MYDVYTAVAIGKSLCFKMYPPDPVTFAFFCGGQHVVVDIALVCVCVCVLLLLFYRMFFCLFCGGFSLCPGVRFVVRALSVLMLRWVICNAGWSILLFGLLCVVLRADLPFSPLRVANNE